MKTLKAYTIWGIIIVSILGTLCHFVYEWTNNNPIIGLFTPVNESTWEHMKLIFFPMIIYSVFFNKKLSTIYPCIYSASAFAILMGTFLIPVLFYTYSGILGYNIAVIDILTFFISVIVAFYLCYRLAQSCRVQKYNTILNFLLFLLGIAFLFFTIYPPDIGIFISPI